MNDVLGVWNVLYAQDRKILTGFDEQQLFFATGRRQGSGDAERHDQAGERGVVLV